MKKVFAFFWSIYATLSFSIFVVLSIIFYTFFVVFKADEKYALRFIYKNFGTAIIRSFFVKIDNRYLAEYTGTDMDGYIVVGNHQTMLDIMVNIVGAPYNILFKFLAKSEIGSIPIFGYLQRRICVLVNRKNPESRKQSYVEMKAEIEKGFSIFIYPEGTRNRTNEPLKNFYDGAFKLAIEMQRPIVVNTLVDIKKINSVESYFSLLPGKVISYWEEPISTKGYTLDDVEKLKAEVKTLMLKRLNKKA